MPKTTKKITTIPATLTRFTATPINQQKKRRVAGYARVSTDHDDQFSSYAAQVDYYTNYIKGRDDWESLLRSTPTMESRGQRSTAPRSNGPCK